MAVMATTFKLHIAIIVLWASNELEGARHIGDSPQIFVELID